MFSKKYNNGLEYALSPEADGLDAFYRRSLNYHSSMAPWINDAYPLKDASVLEIGCGTGAASFALSRVCGLIDSYDIDLPSIAQARATAKELDIKNVRFHDLAPDWALRDKVDLFLVGESAKYDVVLLPAVLEHMQISERIPALTRLWELLRPNGVLVVYDTPNRLYPYDVHTFRLPFADWLPDELMLMYIDRSPRREVADPVAVADDPKHAMYRFGRGVSYHEFDLAIGLNEIEVINDGYSRRLEHRMRNDVFCGMLAETFRRYAPHVPPGFGKDFLELVLRKKWNKIQLIQRRLANDELLDGFRPALMIEAPEAMLEYRIPEFRGPALVIEVLKHPWSSRLVVSDQSGANIGTLDLYSPYHLIDVCKIPLRHDTSIVRFRTEPLKPSQGRQAWILGAGTT